MAFRVENYRGYEKNSLRGFCDLILPSGLILRSCTHHKNGKSEWVSLPARPYKQPDGTPAWQPIVEFTSKEQRSKFCDAALEAVRAHLNGGAL